MATVFDKVSDVLSSALNSQRDVPGTADDVRATFPVSGGLPEPHASASHSQKTVPEGTDTLTPTLPTLDRLGASLQADLDSNKVAAEWFTYEAGADSPNAQENLIMASEPRRMPRFGSKDHIKVGGPPDSVLKALVLHPWRGAKGNN